ncbi:hypothetical protein GCM10011514_52400 [Emticicia aquatilis]|uniref:HTH LytTR-type domain-containing protein n=1 Tax=Emticicia aquatilis TaxID=1537369 RepID=A0A917DZK2_9BACT|nr:LytTR family DNA-binding domain-containing protein [Emticicia aquatilis]GGD81840.1 hypothetical protein GCM10011514_52400 [Emticicia aquatilis]
MKTTEIAIGGRKKVLPHDVVLLVANQNYTTLFLENGDRVLVATTLKKLEKRFSEIEYFFRAHKSFLINLNYIESFTEKTSLKMINQQTVTVSRRKQYLLKKALASGISYS